MVDEVLADGAGFENAVDAVVAAADAPGRFLIESPASGRLLLSLNREELIGTGDLPDALCERLHAMDATLVTLFLALSRRLWGRTDREAVAVVRMCLVQLPSALLLGDDRAPTDDVRARLAPAVRSVVALPLPPRRPRPEKVD